MDKMRIMHLAFYQARYIFILIQKRMPSYRDVDFPFENTAEILLFQADKFPWDLTMVSRVIYGLQ